MLCVSVNAPYQLSRYPGSPVGHTARPGRARLRGVVAGDRANRRSDGEDREVAMIITAAFLGRRASVYLGLYLPACAPSHA